MMDFSRSKLDIVGKSRIWYTISSIVLLICLIAVAKNMITTGFPLILGIDFTGGSIIQFEFDEWDETRDVADLTYDIKLLADKYTERAPQVLATYLSAEESSNGTPGQLIQIRTDAGLIDDPVAQESLYEEIRALGGDFTVLEETQVGAVMGSELATKALQGVFIGLLLILLYITIRLSFDFAVFAIVALVHDIIILLGFFAIFGIEVNSPFVAIILTVVGYSINDTIIIYDRIRENMKVKRHLPFDRLVNQSLLETMARSINTAGTTILAILALLIFGGISLRTFMMGLGVGIATGTYSSIFIASLLLVTWRLRGKGSVVIEEPRPRHDATRIIRDDDLDSDLIDLTDEDEEAPEVITVDRGPQPSTSKRVKPKRRRRR